MRRHTLEEFESSDNWIPDPAREWASSETTNPPISHKEFKKFKHNRDRVLRLFYFRVNNAKSRILNGERKEKIIRSHGSIVYKQAQYELEEGRK